MKRYLVIQNGGAQLNIVGEFDSLESARTFAEAKNNYAIRKEDDMRYWVYQKQEAWV